MCKRNHAREFQRKNNRGQNYCVECHRILVAEWRNKKILGLPTRSAKHILNKDLFRERVPWGKRKIAFELAGLSKDVIGRQYAGCGLSDAYRRQLLSENAGVPHDELWRRM